MPRKNIHEDRSCTNWDLHWRRES